MFAPMSLASFWVFWSSLLYALSLTFWQLSPGSLLIDRTRVNLCLTGRMGTSKVAPRPSMPGSFTRCNRKTTSPVSVPCHHRELFFPAPMP